MSDMARSAMPEKGQMLVDVRTGGMCQPVADDPILSSAQGPWSGVVLEHYAPTSIEMLDLAPPEHRVVIQLGKMAVLEWKENGKFRTLCRKPGQVTIFPAMVPFSLRCGDTGGVIILSLEQRFLRFAASDLLSAPGRFELKQEVTVDDPLLHALGLALKNEAEAGYLGGSAYGESLASALAVHLVRHYSTRQAAPREDRGGLARAQLRRAIDYIHEHMAENFPLSTVARETGLSLYHFARLFKQATGLAPHQYLLQCRIEKARQLLLSTNHTAADIANQLGFCDQSHLTTHFKRTFGVTPKAFRQRLATRKKFI